MSRSLGERVKYYIGCYRKEIIRLLIIKRPSPSCRRGNIYIKKNLDVSSIICVCQLRDYVCLNRS